MTWKFNKLFRFSRQKWGWRKDNQRKFFLFFFFFPSWNRNDIPVLQGFPRAVYFTHRPPICFCSVQTTLLTEDPAKRSAWQKCQPLVNYSSSKAYTIIQFKSPWHFPILPWHWATRSRPNVTDLSSKASRSPGLPSLATSSLDTIWMMWNDRKYGQK